MKKLLAIIGLVFGLALLTPENTSAGQFIRPAPPVPWGWSCSEFYCQAQQDGSRVVAFQLSGIGKWLVCGRLDNGQDVVLDQGEIIPVGDETIIVLPPDCPVTTVWLIVKTPNSWKIIYPWMR